MCGLYGPKFSLQIILFRAKHSRYHRIKKKLIIMYNPSTIQVFVNFYYCAFNLMNELPKLNIDYYYNTHSKFKCQNLRVQNNKLIFL